MKLRDQFPARGASRLSSRAIFGFLLAIAAASPRSSYGQVTTSQYNNARTGANPRETILNPRNVNAKQFGKVLTLRAEGDIYAQPLYLPGVEIPGKGTHHVVFVATERDSVYAFDADGKSIEPLWHVSLLDPQKGIDVPSASDVECPFIDPVVGITSTPVIDTNTGTLYLLARTRERGEFVQKLHALAITTGVEKFGGPVVIRASVTRKTWGLFSSEVSFDPLRENPRTALLLSKGKVYLSWASSCDVGDYHGWMMAYDAQTLRQEGVFNASPDEDQSGIWAGDAGPAADEDGNVFVATGNGKFDAASKGGRDFGDSVLKLSLGADGLAVRDYFTPFDEAKLNQADLDLGSGGPVLLADQQGPHRHELIVGGKGAVLYVVDRDRMGNFHAGSDSQIVQEIPVADGIFGAPAYCNQHVFILASNDVLKDYAVQDGRLSAQPVAQASRKFIDPGATPTISSSGTKDGIVWVIETKGWQSPDTSAVLHAYDAANVAHELYNSNQNMDRDRAGLCLRFTIPTVANGRVYVGAKSEVDVYGLLPAARPQK